MGGAAPQTPRGIFRQMKTGACALFLLGANTPAGGGPAHTPERADRQDRVAALNGLNRLF